MDVQELNDSVLKTTARDLNRHYCEVCLNSVDKRNRKRSKFGKLEKERFKKFASEWEKVIHPFNKIFSRINWTCENDMYACSSCKGSFFKNEYLGRQDVLERVAENENLSIRDENKDLGCCSLVENINSPTEENV